MTDLERVIKAVENAKRRLEDVGYNNEMYRGAHLALKVLLQELNAVAKAEEKADG